MAVLKAEKREGTGKYAAFNLRKKGLIPVVMYGRGVENLNLTVNERELARMAEAGTRLIDLDLGGKKQMAILKKVQYQTLGKHLVHADFNVIDENTPLHVDVEVELVGEAAGVKEGGIVGLELHALQVECLPRNLPAKIVINVTNLEIGGIIYVEDVKAPEGVTLRNPVDLPVVSCHHPSRAVEETPAAAEAGAAPAAGAVAPAGAAAPAAAAKPADDKAAAAKKK